MSMKKPIFASALLGWAAAVLLMFGVSFVKEGAAFAGDFWVRALLLTGWTGVIAFPACLIAGALVNEFLPFSSRWWKPEFAALCGGIAGGLVIVLLMRLVNSGEFVFHPKHLLQGIFGAVPGSVCGFSLARFKQKLLKHEAPTPDP